MEIARNGQEALELFRTLDNKPDIILIDYRLPVKDGLKVTEELLKIDQNLKIIIISSDITIKNKAILTGAISFIEKPFMIDYFIKKISKCVEKELKIIDI